MRRLSKKLILTISAVVLVNVAAVLVFLSRGRDSLAQRFLEELRVREGKRQDEGEEEDDTDDWNQEDTKVFGEFDPNEGIFFFVSTGATDLDARQACLVEAAARLHPGRKVFVIFITANVTDILTSNTLGSLISYKTIHLRHVVASKYLDKPEIRDWFLYSGFQKTEHVGEFLNHALTYVFLFNYGGTVLDFDTILVKSVTGLGPFVSRCDEDTLETHPITMDRKSEILETFMSEMTQFFLADDERSTGDRLMTEVVKSRCKVHFLKELLYKQCKRTTSLKVSSTSDFCPVEADKHWMIFDSVRTKLVHKRVEEQKSFGLRLWRKLNTDVADWGGAMTPDTVFFKIAKVQCPLIVQSLGETGHF